MTKSELIAELSAANPHLLARDVETIVATIFNEITQALARGARVEHVWHTCVAHVAHT